jgi:hypothetical protein
VLATSLDTLDTILERHTDALGADFTPYRNHAYRVINFCAALSTDEAAQLEKMQIAVAFHDLGIWTDHTFDYLEPSIARARTYLTDAGRSAWLPEIEAMILEHHRVRSYRAQPDWLVEPFRRADWIDVTYGTRSFGVPRSLVRDLFTRYPDTGFHRRLVELTLERMKHKPLSPLPVMRW